MCMAEGKGDVSFAKHTTVEEVLSKYPGKYGTTSDYEYLCKDGTRKDIGKHEECFLGFNAAHAVVTREGNKDIDNIVTILTTMSSMYGPSQTNWTKFQLFNSTKYGGANLLFKDSTTELVSISKDNRTYQGFLGDDYVKDVQALKSCDDASSSCDDASSTKQPTSVSTKTTPYAVIVLLVAMVAVMSL
ncbi:unnamed protein product [Porites evermanni]|uniref:Transferrin-like domain-containing protein n=1 Tax=Porites evermanni TaxID=104178 RepID=A0ABN8QAC4_9CNID|nr:unnamed protein product [Porites evermanni]